ncbi:MAG: HEAT repeat domain-containing protein [Planctomycetes bacterium]|nr:HEAT repeat domain-containing protein [Planctomycetota bacterium]
MLRYLLAAAPLAVVLGLGACKTDSDRTGSEPGAPAAAAADAFRETVLSVIERLEAARDLGGGKLERFLADPDPAVRARATLALGRIGQRRALLQIGPRFQDAAPAVQAAALLAAGLARDDRFYTEAARGVGHGDAPVRQRAIEALGRIGSPRSLVLIVSALEDPDIGVACAAADAASRLRDARAVEPLMAALRNGPPRLRLHAASALERFQVPTVDPISERPRVLEPEIVAAMKVAEPALAAAGADADPRVAAAALRALARRGGALADAGALKQALQHEEPEVVEAAVEAIVPQQDEEAVQALVEQLDHGHPHVRWAAIRGLASLHEVVKAAGEGAMRAKVEDRVRQVLAADREVQIQADALVALAMLRGADVLEEQPGAVDSGDYRLRCGLCAAAGRVGGARALARLGRLVTDEDTRVRVAAVAGLADLGGEAAAQRLFRALEDRSASVRARAAEALRDLGDAAATGPLLKAYRESLEEPSVAGGEARLRILQALAHLGGRRYTAELDQALSDPSNLVRHGVVDLLEVMNGFRPEIQVKPPDDHGTPPLAAGVHRRERPHVILYTSKGEIHLELYPDIAPVHVRNFLSLVQNGFYHGKTLHRVVPGHVVQGGDPEGTGYGSLEFTLPDEPAGEPFQEGSVGTAQLGRDSGGCQFFITLAARPHLDGKYTLFGRVRQGMGVVHNLMPGDHIVKASWIPAAGE